MINNLDEWYDSLPKAPEPQEGNYIGVATCLSCGWKTEKIESRQGITVLQWIVSTKKRNTPISEEKDIEIQGDQVICPNCTLNMGHNYNN